MTRQAFPGAWYADGAPSGAWAVLYPDSHIDFHGQRVPLPPAGNVLFLVTDGLHLAGQGHADGQCWVWNGTEWRAVGPTYGTSPCAFSASWLYVSMPGTVGNIAVINPQTFGKAFPITQSVGVRGIALADSAGVHGQDGWYGQHGLAEFVALGDIYVGQGVSGGCVIQDRLLEPGDVQFIRAHRDGDALAVAMWKPQEQQSVCHWLTVSEIAQLPLVQAPPIVRPPVPPKPEPTPMSGITDAQFDTLVRIRSKYGDVLDEKQIGALLNEVAWIHRSEGVGMQSKNAGTIAIQPRTGLTIWRGLRFAGNIGQDVLGSASVGKCIPTRGNAGPADPNTFVAPVEPEGTVVISPPDNPPPSTDLETRVHLLEQTVSRILSVLHSV